MLHEFLQNLRNVKRAIVSCREKYSSFCVRTSSRVTGDILQRSNRSASLVVFVTCVLVVLSHFNAIKDADYNGLSVRESADVKQVSASATSSKGGAAEANSTLQGQSRLHFLWLGPDPATEVSQYQYYRSFGKAVAAHNSCATCSRNLSLCGEQILSSSSWANVLILAIPHSTSTYLDNLIAAENAVEEATQWTSTILREVQKQQGHRGLKVVLAMFINKVYVGLDDKVSWFKLILVEKAQRLKKYTNVESVIFTWSPHAKEWEEEFAIPFVHVPFAADIESFDVTNRCDWNNRSCDVFLHWDTNPSKYSLTRGQLSQTLGETSNVQIFNKKSEKFFNIMSPTNFLSHERYLETLSQCKVHVSTIGMPGKFDLVGTRYFEVMAAGCALLFVERPQLPSSKLAYTVVGLEEDVNVVMFSSVSEFLEKLAHYTTHKTSAKSIVTAARKQALNNTWAERIDRVAVAIIALVNRE